jgi:hypothetical protein
MRCLNVCVVKRLQLGEQRRLRLRNLPRGGVRVANRMHLVFGRFCVLTCCTTALAGLLSSILSRLLAAVLASRYSRFVRKRKKTLDCGRLPVL